MSSRFALVAAATVLASLACVTTSQAGTHRNTTPTGGTCSPSTIITDYTDSLDKTTFAGTYVGNFSALAVDHNGGIAALSDRSSLFTLDRHTLRPSAVQTLADENGAELDSEALVMDWDGTRLITSEVEPSIRRFDREGRITGRLPVPGEFAVAPVGRATRNATFEGLTLMPGGRTLIASMEGPLSGDDGTVRLQTWQRNVLRRSFSLNRQFGYRLDSGLTVSDIAATPDGRMLVLERGYTSGVGNTVRLYLADLKHADDTRTVEKLTGQQDIRLVHKTLLADLVNCPSMGATAKQPQPNPLLDNIEGVAVTGRRADGGLKLLLVSDDNQGTSQITRLYRLDVRLPRH
ncbi:esterase-like activity of phytase family protein [Streptomyces sp. NPDC005065]|uniref:esterase-like activity of phytase family protein n=1 Tax=Streptomyces sp. NPDC005065 TaxID=3154461 RepID=UPI0033B1E134